MNDSSTATLAPPTQRAVEHFHALRLKVISLPVAERLWQRVLNDDQQRQFGGSLRQAAWTVRDAVGMWQQLHPVNFQVAVIEIGLAVNLLTDTDADWLLREGGELPRNPEDARLEAIRRGLLVIDPARMEVWWKGDRIEVEWRNYPSRWQFLLVACRLAKRQLVITPGHIRDGAKANAVSQAKSLLGKLTTFPDALCDFIEPCGKGNQKLKLEPNQIHICAV